MPFLHQHEFPTQLLDKIEKLGISSLKQLFTVSEYDISIRLNITLEEYRAFLRKVARVHAPQPQTVMDLLHESKYISTGWTHFDTLLGGGLPCKQLIQVAGMAGAGKSQFCMSLSAKYLREHKSVVYIDLDQKYSQKRMLQMVPNTQRLFVLVPTTAIDFMQVLRVELEDCLRQEPVQLVIVDSIATLARKAYGPKQFQERQEMLTTCATKLKCMATAYDIPVLITNHASQDDFGRCVSAMGTTWAHLVNTSLTMASLPDQTRLLRIEKSPSTSDAHTFTCEITHMLGWWYALEFTPATNGLKMNDELMEIEKNEYELGKKEGYEIGLKTGYDQGYSLGCEKGTAIGTEIGYYTGCVSYWQSKPHYSVKIKTQVEKLDALLKNFPLLNDVNEDYMKLLLKIRATFKVLIKWMEGVPELQYPPKGESIAF